MKDARAFVAPMAAPGPFWIVDVFAERKYAGNPLAVFTAPASLDDATMQAVARETNFSETTFVAGAEKGAWRVRIFTPAAELPFAGHPTLGTAWVLRETAAKGAKELTLRLGVGDVPVRFGDDGLVWLTARPPTFGPAYAKALLGDVLRLPLEAFDPDLPGEEVDTGLRHLVVPLKDLAWLKRARLDRAKYDAFVAAGGAKGVLLFCRGGYGKDADLAARLFAPALGVAEDPATGSANADLAAYLSKHRVLGSDAVDARVDQGHEIGRPSRLHLRAKGARVEVGGRVVPVARGEFV